MIQSAQALDQAALQPDAREAAMAAGRAAAIKTHEAVMRAKPEWFWHMLRRCEVKATNAAKTAEQTSHGPRANGEAAFIEVYATTLPTLFTEAMRAYQQALNDDT